MAYILPFATTYMVYAAVVPYLPILIRGLGYSPAMIGFLMALFEASGIISPFIFGSFADRMGRYRPGLITTFVLILVAIFPLALWAHPLISILCILILGIGFRSVVPLLDAAATIYLGTHRVDYGRIRVSGSLSFILTVLLLQWIPVLRPNTPGNIAIWVALTSLTALFSMVGVPEAGQKQADTPGSGRQKTGASVPTRKLWTPLFTLGIVIIFLSRIGMAPVSSFFSLFLVESVQWDAVGLMWALSGAAEVPFMFLSGRIIRKFKPLSLLTVAAGATALRLVLYALFPVKAGVVSAQLLHSLCYGLFHPAAVAFVISCIPPERRAWGMSVYLSIGTSLPTLVGNMLSGLILENWGYPVMFGSFVIFPLIALVLYFLFRPRHASPSRT